MVVKRITEEIVGAAEDIKEVVKIMKETVYIADEMITKKWDIGKEFGNSASEFCEGVTDFFNNLSW